MAVARMQWLLVGVGGAQSGVLADALHHRADGILTDRCSVVPWTSRHRPWTLEEAGRCHVQLADIQLERLYGAVEHACGVHSRLLTGAIASSVVLVKFISHCDVFDVVFIFLKDEPVTTNVPKVFASPPAEVKHDVHEDLLLQLDGRGAVLLVGFQLLLVSLCDRLLMIYGAFPILLGHMDRDFEGFCAEWEVPFIADILSHRRQQVLFHAVLEAVETLRFVAFTVLAFYSNEELLHSVVQNIVAVHAVFNNRYAFYLQELNEDVFC